MSLPSEIDQWVLDHRMTVAAAASSAISTVAGFPLDSVKSRLQVKRYSGVLDCVSQTYAQEGIRGFMRGIWVPLGTITVVRTLSFSIYSGTKNVLKGFVEGNPNKWQIAGLGFAGGASSGILISTGSCAFELVKVRAQLEFLIASRTGKPYEPMGTLKGAAAIYRQAGIRGLYYGLPLHAARDTFGTGFYFAIYDSLRQSVARNYSDQLPFGLPIGLAPFACGSLSGIASWVLIYPVDLVKTRVQRDALEGVHPRPSAWQVFQSLSSRGITRLYRGLGVSAFRSCFTHGLQWYCLEKFSTAIYNRAQQKEQASVE